MKLPRGCISSFREHDDYITGFEIDESCSTLLASSADGTITVYDIRKGTSVPTATSKSSHEHLNNKLNNIEPKKDWGPFACIRKSDDQEDELLSICKIKGGRKVICGTQLGVLAVFSWGTWGDISDRFPGHPQSIDALLKVDEDTLLTGSSDGIVRIVQIHPDKLLGILGNHGGFPVEKLKFSAGRKVVGSLSHDNLVRLFDASMLNDDDDDVDDDEDIDDDDSSQKGMDVSEVVDNKVTKTVQKDNSDDDWEDMEDESSDSDESMDDSDDDSDNKKGKKPSKFKFKSDNEAFFEDL
jgi:WD40 repeat protein